jgi:large subunit ribosomal protein L5
MSAEKAAKAPAPAKGGGQQQQKSEKKEKKGAAAQIAGARPKLPAGYMPRLQTLYVEKVVPALQKRFGYKNPMQVPRLQKIVINVGVGDAAQNPRLIDGVVLEIAAISGQRPAIAKARKSISNFKLREKMPIGVFVTLRRFQMWEFLDRLNAIAAPRIRDFRGLPDKGFDGRGNFTIGLKEQIIFPEIDFDKVEKIRGMDVSFVTTARTDQEAYELLRELGLPFRKRDKDAVSAAA